MSAQFPIITAGTAAIDAPVPPSALRELLKNKALVVGGGILLAIIVLAVFAPLVRPVRSVRAGPGEPHGAAASGTTRAAGCTRWAPTSSDATICRACSTAAASPC